jgi:hypothetical protein
MRHDNAALGRLEPLLGDVLEPLLEDDESYVYLAAVNAVRARRGG